MSAEIRISYYHKIETVSKRKILRKTQNQIRQEKKTHFDLKYFRKLFAVFRH